MNLLTQAGVSTPVNLRRMQTDAEAQRERFLGSPTVRVDGVDIEPSANDRTDFGLKCRLYPTAEGLRGLPPDGWVLAALTQISHPPSVTDN